MAWSLIGNIRGPQGGDGADGNDGSPGAAGRGISSVARTSGTGAAGTTDTYTITYSDATTSTFNVVNGSVGGAGPQGDPGDPGVVAATAPATYDSGTQTVGVALGTSSTTAAAGNDSRITGAAQKASNLSDLANAGTARTNLGLGTAATVDTGTSSGNVPLLSTGGRLPIARVASGTPDGTKFVRDDGTLATPSGSSGARTVLVYSSGAYPSRTGGTIYEYVGPTVPSTWQANDTWIKADL